MKIEHELFAHHYILTGDKDKAYKAAYPEAEGKALKTAARRLINTPDVRKYIHAHLAAASVVTTSPAITGLIAWAA